MLYNILRGNLSFFVGLGSAFCVETIDVIDMASIFVGTGATAVIAIEPA